MTGRTTLGCLASLALLSSCSGSGDPSGPKIEPVATILVSATASTVQAGKSTKLSAQAKDASGNALSGRSFTWSSNNIAVATVAADGTLTGVGAGSAVITAASEGKTGEFAVTVTRASLATISVTISPNQLTIGQTAPATTVLTDSTGTVATDAVLSWSSTDQTVATVDSNGLVTATGAGTARIDARAEGIVGSGNVSVIASPGGPVCSQLSLALGEIRQLTTDEKSFFCVTAGVSASEYVVIPFNNSAVAASTVGLQVKGANTSAPAASVSNQLVVSQSRLSSPASASGAGEWAFREREYRDLKPVFASMTALGLRMSRSVSTSNITGIPATPTVGSVFPINANLSGNTCTSAKVLHGARVVAVLPHVMVLADTLAPAGGYTNDEMAAFGQSFEDSGYGLDTLNFGAPTDIDSNGRVAVFFTQSVNLLTAPTGGFIAGLQASRDLAPISQCVASNEGEIFYIAVPDPNKTLNANYPSKSSLANGVLAVLVHEFQHLINIGRRAYVNGASSAEEVWLNEGLSHIAEELLYYEASGRTPRTNIDLPSVQVSQAQLNAINAYQVQNLGRLRTFMVAAEGNSPYAANDDLETRGAIWQLLRYAADRGGGAERSTWFGLVNSTTAGQANFNAVFGDIVSMTRDWAVAQYADDIGISVAAKYTNPSWNFRSLMPAINSGVFPLAMRTLLASPIDLSLVGGSAAYIRFQVGGGITANLTATASGQPLSSSVDVIVMRTK